MSGSWLEGAGRVSHRLRVATGVIAGAALMAATAAEARASGFGERPMSATVAELRAAEGAARRADDAGATWLLDEVVYRVESSRATTTRYRRIIAIDTAAGVAEFQTFTAMWSPWFEDRPIIQARILDSRDWFHELDPATVEAGPPAAGDSHVVSDRRVLRAPLPAIAPGSIVEMVLTIRERKPIFASGAVHRYRLGHRWQTMPQSRVVIDAPAGMRLKIDERPHRLVKRRVEDAGGRVRHIYEAAGLPPYDTDHLVPGDVSITPSIGVTTGSSWAQVAGAYAAVVERQIAAGPLPQEARIQPAASRRETIRRAVDKMRRELRYTGLELGENEITPWTPAQVWERRYGDCKDLATFLVAMLAGAGIEARLALLDSGPGEDLPASLPGLGTVDHAIVYVPREKLWIDPTVELARPGQLASHVQGRVALIASPSARNLIRIPDSRAADNTITEDRRITIADLGAGSVVEVARYRGLRELVARYDFRESPPNQVRRVLEGYVKSSYGAQRLARHRTSDTGDVSRPFTIDLTAEQAEVAYSTEDEATVWIDVAQLFQVLPEDLRPAAGQRAAPEPVTGPRSRHPRALEPHVVEWRYVITAPDGFEMVALPQAVERTLGPASFSQKFAASGTGARGTLRFTLARGRLTPKEVDDLKTGVAALMKRPRPQLRFEHRATKKITAGDLVGGLAEAKRLLDAAPRSWGRMARYSYLAGEAGLGRESVHMARQAVQAGPSAARAHGALGSALRRDPIGRLDVRGFDRRGAIAALEKAASLAPTQAFYQAQLGVLHSLGDDAVYLEGDLAKAASALEKARELGDTSGDVRLVQVLLALGRTGRLRELADGIEAADVAGAARLAGAEKDAEFKQALAQIPSASREQAVATFNAAAMQVGDHERVQRSYRLASDVIPARAAEKTIKHLRSVPAQPRTVGDLFSRFVAEAMVRGDRRWLSRDLARFDHIGNLAWAFGRSELYFDASSSPLVPSRQLFACLASASYEVHSFGRAGPVEAINVKVRGASSARRFYVSHEGAGGKELRVLGVPEAPHFLAASVLRAADAGRIAEARRILDWAAGDPVATRRPTQLGMQMPRFWQRGQRGDRRRIRLAAASLLVGIDPKRSLEVLTRECPRSGELADACRHARMAALMHASRWREADQVLRELKLEPDADYAGMKIAQQIQDSAWPELEQFAAGKLPPETAPFARYGLAISWVARGQPARAKGLVVALRAGKARSEPWLVNNVGFLSLSFDLAPAELSALLPDLERMQRSEANPFLHHTLASVYAALGRHREARDAVRQVAATRGDAKVDDQLIPARLAAAAGLTAAARRAYQEIISDPEASKTPHSTAALARRWLASLPAGR